MPECTKDLRKRVVEYAKKEYCIDRVVELHLLECGPCFNKVKRIEEQRQLNHVDQMIRKYVPREVFDQIASHLQTKQKHSEDYKGVRVSAEDLGSLTQGDNIEEFFEKQKKGKNYLSPLEKELLSYDPRAPSRSR